MRGALICCALVVAPSAIAQTCALPTGEVRLSTRRPAVDPDARMTTGFGMRLHPLLNEQRMHTGIDWAAKLASPVIAAAPGRVLEAGWKGQYGKTVIIDHGGGLVTLYAHLHDIAVHAGDCVANGARIGGVGSTGLASMVALHFEVQRNGTAVDPFTVAVVGIDP